MEGIAALAVPTLEVRSREVVITSFKFLEVVDIVQFFEASDAPFVATTLLSSPPTASRQQS